ncbi:MAG: hypothetical protein SO170_08465, partial [Butyribacter sp.]|nr:hypothetical protein [Butyribacter sp.]
QRLIDSFVNAVYLYEDKIILTFNYKDGSKTITLADVEGSDLSSFGARKTENILCISVFSLFCCRQVYNENDYVFYCIFLSAMIKSKVGSKRM